MEKLKPQRAVENLQERSYVLDTSKENILISFPVGLSFLMTLYLPACHPLSHTISVQPSTPNSQNSSLRDKSHTDMFSSFSYFCLKLIYGCYAPGMDFDIFLSFQRAKFHFHQKSASEGFLRGGCGGNWGFCLSAYTLTPSSLCLPSHAVKNIHYKSLVHQY